MNKRTNRRLTTTGAVKGYKKVSKGVYQYPSGNFKVTKVIFGVKITNWFSKVTPAKNYYKSLL